MQCSKCHYEFSSADHSYCPVCGTPVRPLLPPLPPRQSINGCLLGCLVSVVAFFVIFILFPLVLLIAICSDHFPANDFIRQATEQIDSDFEPSQASSFQYNLYGTLGRNTQIRISLDEPAPNHLQGYLHIGSDSEEDLSQPGEISGTITPSGDVSLTVTDPATQQKQQWRGMAVTNPDGIAAIKGTVTPGGEQFYVTRQ